MATSYRATVTGHDGTEYRYGFEGPVLTQDEWDALVDAHEVPGSLFPVGVRERKRKDGTWVVDAGWDIRPREVERPAETDAERDARLRAQVAEEHAAVVAANREQDRRENRRAYYLRTGR